MICLRQILKIRYDDVREQKIRNSHVRKKFLNIETIENIISKRRLISIEKIIRMSCKCVPSTLISTFQMKKDRQTDRISLYDIPLLTILINIFLMLIQLVASTLGLTQHLIKVDEHNQLIIQSRHMLIRMILIGKIMNPKKIRLE